MEVIVLVAIVFVLALFSLVMYGKTAETMNAIERKRRRRLEEKTRCPTCRQSARRSEFTEGKCPDCGAAVVDPSTLELI